MNLNQDVYLSRLGHGTGMKMHGNLHTGVAVGGWWEYAAAKYGWIWVGIAFGFAAKYGLLLKRGQKIKVRHVVADVLLLGLVALISYSIVTRIGLTNEAAAMSSAFITVGADRFIRLMTERFWARVEAVTMRELTEDVKEERGEFRNVLQTKASAKRLLQGDDEPPIRRARQSRVKKHDAD